jgi:hypothetical protein
MALKPDAALKTKQTNLSSSEHDKEEKTGIMTHRETKSEPSSL